MKLTSSHFYIIYFFNYLKRLGHAHEIVYYMTKMKMSSMSQTTNTIITPEKNIH